MDRRQFIKQAGAMMGAILFCPMALVECEVGNKPYEGMVVTYGTIDSHVDYIYIDAEPVLWPTNMDELMAMAAGKNGSIYLRELGTEYGILI